MSPHQVERVLPFGLDGQDDGIVGNLQRERHAAKFLRRQLYLEGSLGAAAHGGDQLDCDLPRRLG